MSHRRPRTSRWIDSPASFTASVLALMVVAAGLFLAACGSTPESVSTTATTGSPSSPSTTATAALGARELGDQIGTTYVAALHDVSVALQGKPDVAGVRAQVQKMKDDAISKLVELGRAREAMSTADRATVDARITAALDAAGTEDWYATYNEVWTHYSAADSDFANLIAAFNVIGQYANFDLLKKQLPEEATRLGIE